MSDTHDNLTLTRKAVTLLLEHGSELILHLGDIIAPFTLNVMRKAGAKRLIAVYGNNCGEKLLLAKVAEKLGYEIYYPPHIVKLEDMKILMIHGSGTAEETRHFAESLAISGRYNAVLYGHTHTVDNRIFGNTLLLNPGEVCGYLTGKSTIALLDTKKRKTEIVEIK